MMRSSLAPIHQQLHATFRALDDWEIPVHYGDVAAECAAVRQAVGLLDLSYRGKIEVTGADRAAFLHNLTTQDIKGLAPGRGCYAMLLNGSAKILVDLHVFAEDDRHWLSIDSAVLAAKAVRLLDASLFTERVTLTDRTTAWAALTLQGPRAETLLAALDAPVAALARELDHITWSLDSRPLRLIRRSFTGERGYLLILDAADVVGAWQRLLAAGAAFGVRPVGYDALDVLRLEASIPRYGRDMDETTLQPETGLARAVSDMKGCYVGQEIVARVQNRGQLQRRLVGLRVDGATTPHAGDRLLHDGREVGHITSAVYSPTLKEPIALAYLHRSAQAPGAALTIRSASGALRARLAPLPFVPAQH